jgi:transcriptional regulator with XRE-family HTH domain
MLKRGRKLGSKTEYRPEDIARVKFIGRKLKKRRLQLDYSQTEVAKKIGVTFQQVQKYEKGANSLGQLRIEPMRLALKIPYHKVGFLVNKYNPKRGDTSMFVKDLKEIEKSLEYFFSLANVASKPIELLNVTTELVKNKITRYE